jgi:hypothetical protein
VHEWCCVLCVRWKRPTVLRRRRPSVCPSVPRLSCQAARGPVPR